MRAPSRFVGYYNRPRVVTHHACVVCTAAVLLGRKSFAVLYIQVGLRSHCELRGLGSVPRPEPVFPVPTGLPSHAPPFSTPD